MSYWGTSLRRSCASGRILRASLERQLAAFAANTRGNAVMHQETMNLTDQQINDVSAYLAAQ